MKKKDLRKEIIPKTLSNNDEDNKLKKEYETTDLIYLDSYEKYIDTVLADKNTDVLVSVAKTSATDHAKIHNIYITGNETEKGNSSCAWKLRSAYNNGSICIINELGQLNGIYVDNKSSGIRPSLCYNLSTKEQLELDIIDVKDKNGKVIYHCLKLGERPITKVDKSTREKLKKLYNNGNIKEGLKATGRWYTDNGQKEDNKNFAGIHSPEFELEGNKYVREISNPEANCIGDKFSDDTEIEETGKVIWLKTEEVKWIITNWDEMPTNINPNGNGKAKWFDLISEEILTSNIPFYPYSEDKNSIMWQNSTIRGYLNGIDVRNIKQNGSTEHSADRGGDFTGECNFLNETFNLGREPIQEYTIPESETEIVDDAFNGCVTLKKLNIHSNVSSIGKRAFEGLDFKYIYRKKSTSEIVFSNELPLNKEDIEDIIELSELNRNFLHFDVSNLVLQEEKLKRFCKLSDILSKNKFVIPDIYGKKLIENDLDEEFCANSDFRFFKSEFKNINEILLNFPEEERLDFYKFANILGCFSTDKIIDKNGRETEILLGQKATTVLSKLLNTEYLKIGKYHELFDSMPFETETNQAFLDFIIKEQVSKIKDETGRTIKKESKFENLELLMSLEKSYPGIFTKVMGNFDQAKSFRESLDESGKPLRVPWEGALKKYYLSNEYIGVTRKNRDIAEVFAGKGLEQEIFDEAVDLRKQANTNNIPEHILGEGVREETILESIERIKNETEKELIEAKQIIEELYDKQFTYEWLSKNDPRNSIMGLFCSCCGTITSTNYGGNIAKSSIIAENVQNLVVRNSKGEIISKGTFYLNKEKGYAVINDFELNQSYRNHEDSDQKGRYDVEPDSKEEEERELIFKAFQRGVQAFVEKYDKQNPQNPIKQINVGTGYNRLKRQIEQFEKASSNLTVPSEYEFVDAMQGQYIIYKRKEKEIELEEKRDGTEH